VSLNARIASNGDMQLCSTIFRDPLSAIDLINLKIIANLGGVAKQMKKLTPLNSRLRRVNLALTSSSTPTVVETIRQIPISIYSGRIGSIANGTSRNTIRSMKTDQTQSILS